MKLALPLLASGLCLLAVHSAHAQIIVWGSAQNMSGDTDVVVPVSGTLVDAATFYSSAVTVNTVKFNPLTASSGSYTDASGDISVTTPSGGAGPYTGAFTSSSPSSTNYSNLTSVLGFTVGNTGTVTLSGLVSGQTYQVEAWSFYTGQSVPGSTTFTGTTPVNLVGATGQYALGTFTATGTTETFGYGVNNTDNHAIINAISVFDTSGGSAVPEPSTYALIFAGLGGLYFVSRRKQLRQVRA
jgi:hypothetical protein